ncbi:MAG: nitroreductase family deazaflavin-dependent oxidoreductase [Solirubrobacterales bacterium]
MSATGDKHRPPRYLDLVEKSWPLTYRLMGLHTFLYRRTGGRIGQSAPGLRAKMLLLDHVGARSGKRRTLPLLYVADGDDIVLIASKGGYPKNPAWYYNLRANPDTTVQVGSEVRPVHAREASEEEYERLWEIAVSSYGGYRDYQARTDRKIPLIVLERRPG